MGLSKKHLDTCADEVSINLEALGDALKNRVPEIEFAFILGSSADTGIVKPYSDLDIAVYLNSKLNMRIFEDVMTVCKEFVGPVRCDLGFLNGAEPVYRFEALKGRLLFARDRDALTGFFSLTCREYETQMIHYARQRRYRLEAHA
jgi:predicted nucleotidyltransferase